MTSWHSRRSSSGCCRRRGVPDRPDRDYDFRDPVHGSSVKWNKPRPTTVHERSRRTRCRRAAEGREEGRADRRAGADQVQVLNGAGSPVWRARQPTISRPSASLSPPPRQTRRRRERPPRSSPTTHVQRVGQDAGSCAAGGRAQSRTRTRCGLPGHRRIGLPGCATRSSRPSRRVRPPTCRPPPTSGAPEQLQAETQPRVSDPAGGTQSCGRNQSSVSGPRGPVERSPPQLPRSGAWGFSAFSWPDLSFSPPAIDRPRAQATSMGTRPFPGVPRARHRRLKQALPRGRPGRRRPALPSRRSRRPPSPRSPRPLQTPTLGVGIWPRPALARCADCRLGDQPAADVVAEQLVRPAPAGEFLAHGAAPARSRCR